MFAIGITSAVAARQTPAAQNASADFFESRIRPILAANCFDCHTTDKKGGLRLDSREALLQGGESGPAIAPGKPDESLLIQAVKQIAGAPKMPYGRPKLKAEDIDALVEWVRGGWVHRVYVLRCGRRVLFASWPRYEMYY